MLDLGAEAGEDVGQEEVVIQTGLVWSVVASENETVVWILVAPACYMVQEISEALKWCFGYILACDISLSSIHEDSSQLKPIRLGELNSSLSLVVRFEVLCLLVLLSRKVLMIVRRTVKSIPISLTWHVHLKDLFQVQEEIIRYQPDI